MSITYNVVADLDVRYDDAAADSAIELVAEYSGAVARSELGWTEVTFTIPAAGLRQAIRTATAIIESAPWPAARSLRVLTTDDYDRFADRIDAPMLTAAQAADRLGVSRQAVHKLIRSQTLPARQVGTRWLISADAVDRRIGSNRSNHPAPDAASS